MSSPAFSRRVQIPSSELSDYLIDADGAVWRKNGHRNGRDKRLASITFRKAMQCLGERVGIALVPLPVIPGIWKMSFAGTVEGQPFLGDKSLSHFFQQHAFGRNRIHPKWWPAWSQRAQEVAASVDDDEAPIWTVLTHLKHGSDALSDFMKSVDDPENVKISHQAGPIVVLGPLARFAIFGESSL
jgi:hypothetical protein